MRIIVLLSCVLLFVGDVDVECHVGRLFTKFDDFQEIDFELVIAEILLANFVILAAYLDLIFEVQYLLFYDDQLHILLFIKLE